MSNTVWSKNQQTLMITYWLFEELHTLQSSSAKESVMEDYLPAYIKVLKKS